MDLTRRNGRPQARLLDLVPGRSGKAYADWLTARGERVHRRGRRGHLGSVPRLRQRDPRRARRRHRRTRRLPRRQARPQRDGGDPAPGPARTTRPPRPQARPALPDPQRPPRRRRHGSPPARSNGSRPGWTPATPTIEVTVAWRCYQQLRSAYHAKNLAEGQAIASQDRSTSFPTCPIPEIARLGRTLRAWRTSSWPTSPPAAPTTAAPKPSTASSNSTAGSPAASATPTTTD